MSYRIVLIFLATFLINPQLSYAGEKAAYCNIAKSAIHQASDIRGLAQKRRVPCYVHNREQVKKYLLNAIETKIPAKKLENEEVVYKALGMIPDSFDYKNGLVDLYLSQIGGYYDPEKKHFVMAGWMPSMLQTTIAVHELTHALQDQYFRLDTFIDHKDGKSDQLMARSALVEGDATAVMVDYTRALSGQGGISDQADVNSVMMQNVFGAAMLSSMGGVPQSLQNMLIFPYTSGLRFAHAVLQKGGYKEIDRAFRRPPNSTEEILHPEIYLKRKKSYRAVKVHEMYKAGIVPAGTKTSFQDVIGEFGISAIMSVFLKEKAVGAKAAAGWGGDNVVIFELPDGATTKKVVAWRTAWDTKKDAQEFFDTYKQGLEQRYDTISDSANSWKGKSPERNVEFVLRDLNVDFVATP